MQAFEVVAAVIIVFFGFGIAMGMLIVMVLPHRAAKLRHRRGSRQVPPARRADDGEPP